MLGGIKANAGGATDPRVVRYGNQQTQGITVTPSNGLLLVTKEPGTVAAVAAALERNGDFSTGCVCGDFSQLLARLKPGPAHAVLVDIDTAPSRTLAELEPIIARFTDTRFIVVSSLRRDDLMLEAMQIGARHFLVKQSIAADLLGVLRRLVPSESAEVGRSGVGVLLLSASGGCGATTLAINLADELPATESTPALLVDLDCHYGALVSYLGVEGRYGLTDVLADPARLDAQLISSTAVPYSNRLHVLIGPASVPLPQTPTVEHPYLDTAMGLCKRAYQYTVIDAPRVPIDLAARLARASQVTLIVFQVSVKDIRIARTMRAGLLERGVSPDRIVLLANRYRKRHSMIDAKEVQTALGGVGFERIRDDFRSAIRSLNYGRPLSQVAPRSTMRRDLRRFATNLYNSFLQDIPLRVRG
jgi:pilus assembly protein CpaE